MELKILGTVSPYSKGTCNCPGFLITSDDNKILLDAGNGITRLMDMPEDLKNLNVFISHLHKDHYADLFSIGYASYIYKREGQLRDLVNVFLPVNYEKSDYYGVGADYTDYKAIALMREQYWQIKYLNNVNIKIGDMNAQAMPTSHSLVTYAFKIEQDNKKIVYTSDTGYGAFYSLVNFAKDCDLLICDSSFVRENNILSKDHLYAYQAAEIARLSNTKELLLTHFWPEIDKNKYLDEAKMFFENTDVAVEGNVYVLGGKHGKIN